jgi:hypothetical protein
MVITIIIRAQKLNVVKCNVNSSENYNFFLFVTSEPGAKAPGCTADI